jgi:nucleoside-diphosphate-sugar epimerase
MADRFPKDVEMCPVGDLAERIDWNVALKGVDAVVHLAARVHVLKDRARDPLAEFRRVNVEATLRLAEACAGRVGRFVYVSSVHAMCRTASERLNEQSLCRPDSPYGQSKWEAEQALWRLSGRTGLPVVVLRPPPVYGPEGQGNLMRLFRLVQRGWPLPLGRLESRRSFVYVENLADAIRVCVESPAAAGQTFLVSDGEEVSTAEMLARFARCARRPARLWNAPLAPLRLAGRLLGRGSAVERLLGSLTVDSAKIRETLNWRPPFSLDAGLAATAEWLLSDSSNARRAA